MEHDCDSEFVNEIAQSQPMMRAYLAKLLANSSSTDDVLQEANKVVWLKRADWDPETPFLKWAYRICYFKAKAYLRDQGREKLVFRSDLLEVLSEDHPWGQSGSAREDALVGCLQKLEGKNRKMVLKHYQKGQTLASMAREFGLEPNTLSQRIRRVRLVLHDCVQKTMKTKIS